MAWFAVMTCTAMAVDIAQTIAAKALQKCGIFELDVGEVAGRGKIGVNARARLG